MLFWKGLHLCFRCPTFWKHKFVFSVYSEYVRWWMSTTFNHVHSVRGHTVASMAHCPHRIATAKLLMKCLHKGLVEVNNSWVACREKVYMAGSNILMNAGLSNVNRKGMFKTKPLFNYITDFKSSRRYLTRCQCYLALAKLCSFIFTIIKTLSAIIPGWWCT